MFWAPYSASEMKTINAWFENRGKLTKQKEQSTDMNNTIKSIVAFFKNLIFDRTIVKSIKANRVNKHMLNMYLQEGKISMSEYLYLNR